MIIRFIFMLLLMASCQDGVDPAYRELRKRNQKGGYVYRTSSEFTSIPPMILATREPYPWEEKFCGNLKRITKEYFRCKGSASNNARMEKGERVADCGGMQKHSLPLRNGKEFIYPILLALLNYLQEKTNKKVVITCGHRCPAHNSYIQANAYSKHMVGAEVAFYVEGMELEPGLIVKHIIEYYKDHPNPQFQEFKRYEKEDVNVSIMPWFNKEIFIKLFSKNEGRDLDNNHPYPYVSIQVRYDRDTQSQVTYSWEQAQTNYLRY